MASLWHTAGKRGTLGKKKGKLWQMLEYGSEMVREGGGEVGFMEEMCSNEVKGGGKIR